MRNVEVFFRKLEEQTPESVFWNEADNAPAGEGFFFWYCFPGCLPESSPFGPYATLEAAEKAAEEIFGADEMIEHDDEQEIVREAYEAQLEEAELEEAALDAVALDAVAIDKAQLEEAELDGAEEPFELTTDGRIRIRFEGRQCLDLLPRECVRDCSGQGDATEAVEYWIGRLSFEADPELVREHLQGCGAWDAEELSDDAANLRRIVWIYACDIREAEHGAERGDVEGPSPVYLMR